MKITEVIQPSDRALRESIVAENDTGFATEDLMKIHRSHNGQWSESMTYEEILAEMDEMDAMSEEEATAFLKETYKK